MPNLPAHLSLALEAIRRLSYPIVDRHVGAFLLGCTSPDIRAMTKWRREETHFAPLTVKHIGAGVKGLLQTHPDPADSSQVTDATRVFLSGYFTHLVADETWILEVYRPYFDGHRPFADEVQANIWDRALQLDMDRSACEELGDMGQVRSLLDGSECGVGVGFIGPETLGEWRGWVTEFTEREFAWDRLRFLTNRMYRDNADAMGMVEEFLGCVPRSLEEAYGEIPDGKISAYREKVLAESVRLIKEYLGAPQGD